MCNRLQFDQPWKYLRLAVALLAVAVVGWGLHYKLSLYTPAEIAHSSSPAAKLLSQRERVVQDQSASLCSPGRPAVLGIFLCNIIIVLIGLLRSSSCEVLSPNQHYFTAIFEKIWSIRPPPCPCLFA